MSFSQLRRREEGLDGGGWGGVGSWFRGILALIGEFNMAWTVCFQDRLSVKFRKLLTMEKYPKNKCGLLTEFAVH